MTLRVWGEMFIELAALCFGVYFCLLKTGNRGLVCEMFGEELAPDKKGIPAKLVLPPSHSLPLWGSWNVKSSLFYLHSPLPSSPMFHCIWPTVEDLDVYRLQFTAQQRFSYVFTLPYKISAFDADHASFVCFWGFLFPFPSTHVLVTWSTVRPSEVQLGKLGSRCYGPHWKTVKGEKKKERTGFLKIE